MAEVVPERLISHVKYHFHEGPGDQPCSKKVRPNTSRKAVPCRKPRGHENHLYYPCPVKTCKHRFYSLESRLMHVEGAHRARR